MYQVLGVCEVLTRAGVLLSIPLGQPSRSTNTNTGGICFGHILLATAPRGLLEVFDILPSRGSVASRPPYVTPHRCPSVSLTNININNTTGEWEFLSYAAPPKNRDPFRDRRSLQNLWPTYCAVQSPKRKKSELTAGWRLLTVGMYGDVVIW